ncbi:MAG: hypothetical protein P1V36_11260, partial [Planctomycetota bacterium]|nr:hypothetical protein [Planctomycetota bacterium]
MNTPSTARAAAPMLLLGLAILSVGHLVVYLCLAGDARSALSVLEAEHDVAALESARKPAPPPAAGTAEYSPWLRSYERWHAAGEYTVHARHEGLVRIGMILSFLIGLGLLGQGFLRTAKTPRRRVTDQPARARPCASRRPTRA